MHGSLLVYAAVLGLDYHRIVLRGRQVVLGRVVMEVCVHQLRVV